VSYAILDNLASMIKDGFETQEDAENYVIEALDSDRHPFWITDDSGDIVALVYCSVVYEPKAPASFLST